MSLRERRRKPRNSDDLGGSAFIEIRHSFGPIRKSVYKVVEFNEHGISFLMPTADGYFREGQPLEFSLITPDLAKVESFGLVRYHHPYNDETGNSYYRVGVEHRRLGTIPKQDNFRIRPDRLSLAELESKHAIYFSLGDKEYGFPLADISRYSAAFLCTEEEGLGLGVSNALDEVEIAFGRRTIFDGIVVVTRRISEGELCRIVVEPRSAIFDIDAIEAQERIAGISHSVDNLMESTRKFQQIDPVYKALVADTRAFLEGFREILEAPLAAKPMSEIERAAFLDEMSEVFNAKYDEYWIALEKLAASFDFSDEQHRIYKSYLQRHIHPLILSAPICHRIYYKPLGYPGDYEMMRMIRENIYDGPTLLSKLIHAHAMRNPLAGANRNRIEYLAGKICDFVESRPQEEVRILSIACGPALEIQHLIDTRPEVAGRIRLTLLDQEIKALRYSQDAIYMKRILKNCNIRVDLIHRNIGSFLKQIARGRVDLPPFDMIYIFGLFDYFDDRTCSFCMNKSATLLKEDGKMLVSNYSLDGHAHRVFMEYAFEWFMVYRDLDQMRKLGEMMERPCSIRVDEEPFGVIKFLELDFGEAS